MARVMKEAAAPRLSREDAKWDFHGCGKKVTIEHSL